MTPTDTENLKACAAAGRAIQTLRINLGLSRPQLAERLGLSAGFVNYLEEGKRIGSLDTYIKAAALFRVPLSDLFDGVVPEATVPLGPSISLDGLKPRQVVLVSALVRELNGEAK